MPELPATPAPAPEAPRPAAPEVKPPEQLFKEAHVQRRETAATREPVITAAKDVLEKRFAATEPQRGLKGLFGRNKQRTFVQLGGRREAVTKFMTDNPGLTAENATTTQSAQYEKIRTEVREIYKFSGGRDWEKRFEALEPGEILADAKDYTGAIARELVLGRYLDLSTSELQIQEQMRDMVKDVSKPLNSRQFVRTFFDRMKATTRSKRELGRVQNRLTLSKDDRGAFSAAFSKVYEKKDSEPPSEEVAKQDREQRRKTMILDTARPYGFTEEQVTTALADPAAVTDEKLRTFAEGIQKEHAVFDNALDAQDSEKSIRSELIAVSETTDITAVTKELQKTRQARLQNKITEGKLKLFQLEEKELAEFDSKREENTTKRRTRRKIDKESRDSLVSEVSLHEEAEKRLGQERSKQEFVDRNQKLALLGDRVDGALVRGVMRFRAAVAGRAGAFLDVHDGLVQSRIEKGAMRPTFKADTLAEDRNLAFSQTATRLFLDIDARTQAIAAPGVEPAAPVSSAENPTQASPLREAAPVVASPVNAEVPAPQPQAERTETMNIDERSFKIIMDAYKIGLQPLREKVGENPSDGLARFQLTQAERALDQMTRSAAGRPITERMTFGTGITVNGNEVRMGIPWYNGVLNAGAFENQADIVSDHNFFKDASGTEVPNAEKQARRKELRAELVTDLAAHNITLPENKINGILDSYLRKLRVVNPEAAKQFGETKARAEAPVTVDGNAAPANSEETQESSAPSTSEAAVNNAPVTPEPAAEPATGAGESSTAASPENPSPASPSSEATDTTEATVAIEQNQEEQKIQQKTYDTVMGAMQKQLELLRGKPIPASEKPLREFEIYQLEQAIQQVQAKGSPTADSLRYSAGIIVEQNGQRKELQVGMPVFTDTLEEWNLLTTTDYGQGLNGTETRELLAYRSLMKDAAAALSPEQKTSLKGGVVEAIREYRTKSGKQLFSPADETAEISRIADNYMTNVQIVNPQNALEHTRRQQPKAPEPVGSTNLEEMQSTARTGTEVPPVSGGSHIGEAEARIAAIAVHSNEKRVRERRPKTQKEWERRYREVTKEVFDGYGDLLDVADTVLQGQRRPDQDLQFAIDAGKAAWKEVEENKTKMNDGTPLAEIYTTKVDTAAGKVSSGLPAFEELQNAANQWLDEIADNRRENLTDEAYLQTLDKQDAARVRNVTRILQLSGNAGVNLVDRLNPQKRQARYDLEAHFIRSDAQRENRQMTQEQVQAEAKQRIDSRVVIDINKAVRAVGESEENQALLAARERDSQMTQELRAEALRQPGPREIEQRGIDLTRDAMQAYVSFLERKAAGATENDPRSIEYKSAQKTLQTINSNGQNTPIGIALTREVDVNDRKVRTGMVLSDLRLDEMGAEITAMPDSAEKAEQQILYTILVDGSLEATKLRTSDLRRGAIRDEQLAIARKEIEQSNQNNPDVPQVTDELVDSRVTERMSYARVILPEQVTLSLSNPNNRALVRQLTVKRQQIAEEQAAAAPREVASEDPNFGRIKRQSPVQGERPARNPEEFENFNAWMGMSNEVFDAAVRKVQDNGAFTDRVSEVVQRSNEQVKNVGRAVGDAEIRAGISAVKGAIRTGEIMATRPGEKVSYNVTPDEVQEVWSTIDAGPATNNTERHNIKMRNLVTTAYEHALNEWEKRIGTTSPVDEDTLEGAERNNMARMNQEAKATITQAREALRQITSVEYNGAKPSPAEGHDLKLSRTTNVKDVSGKEISIGLPYYDNMVEALQASYQEAGASGDIAAQHELAVYIDVLRATADTLKDTLTPEQVSALKANGTSMPDLVVNPSYDVVSQTTQDLLFNVGAKFSARPITERHNFAE